MTDVSLLSAPWRNAPSDRPIGWYCAAPPSQAAVPWSILHGRIGAWQALLDSLAPPGQRWLLHLRAPLEFAAALIACWERGDSVMLPADDRPETLAGVDRVTEGRLGDAPRGHRAGPDAGTPRWGTLDTDALALSLYTSGSSGDPQRLDKCFAQLDAELSVQARLWPLKGRLVISQVSHQHIYGLLFAILRPLCERALMAMSLCRYPETLSDWLARLSKLRHSTSTGLSSDTPNVPSGVVLITAPPPLERLPEELDWRAAPQMLSRIHSSGAPLSQAASEHALRILGVPVSEIYGSSETGGIAWRIQQHNACWTPFSGIEIRDDDQGTLWLRSPFLDTADWQRQADRISLETSGFRLLGRVDRILKVGGKRLSLTSMDRTLGTYPDVLQARTIALPERDTRLGAIVQLEPQSIPQDHTARRALTEALRHHLLETFESTVIPRYWRFVEAWPSNSQGKLSGTVVAHLFRDLQSRRLPRWLGVEFEGDERCRVTLEVPERLIYVQGHFDAKPVVPGIVIVQWAIELAREHLGLQGEFHRLERIKFPRLLCPGDRVELLLFLSPVPPGGERNVKLVFTLKGRQATHASGKALFSSIGDR
ncbi:AMP-binding protein [Halomonas sp. M20]|uniref:AMP-binding protein n=1 Tax=Halomonas sp. M20 TaxID=2763264 RepID=UPI001D0BDBDF|nr:AMP-binding protein [Halomonas sp. M20]